MRYVLDHHLLHAGLEAPRADRCAPPTHAAPRTWLLKVGWLRSRAGPLPVAYWSV